jgi:hypothetical protein
MSKRSSSLPTSLKNFANTQAAKLRLAPHHYLLPKAAFRFSAERSFFSLFF